MCICYTPPFFFFFFDKAVLMLAGQFQMTRTIPICMFTREKQSSLLPYIVQRAALKSTMGGNRQSTAISQLEI
jgi:hypothetical protein